MTNRTLFICSLAALSFVVTPLVASAAARLSDQEVKALLGSIENKRSAFEGSLDDTLKNSTIKTPRGEIKTNEFFDDLQDQVTRTRERFDSDYSASSEVISLLQYASRLDTWATSQPAGFRGSQQWTALAADFRRLAAAYNTTLLGIVQQGGSDQARRVNDAELKTTAANIDKNLEGFQKAYAGALTANAALTPENRQSAITNVDAMKASAKALATAVDKKEKGEVEADALMKANSAMIATTLKLPPDAAANAAWTPVRNDLVKIALAYEATPSR